MYGIIYQEEILNPKSFPLLQVCEQYFTAQIKLAES